MDGNQALLAANLFVIRSFIENRSGFSKTSVYYYGLRYFHWFGRKYRTNKKQDYYF